MLDLPEMGAEGEFQVIDIAACPEIESVSRRIVTRIFRHSVGLAYNLWLEGQDDPIGVTERHPFWSVDREAWIAARELLVGERLLTASRTVQVRGFDPRGTEPVYNLEIDGDHRYRVGEQGLLVHNASAPAEISKAFERELKTFNCTATDHREVDLSGNWRSTPISKGSGVLYALRDASDSTILKVGKTEGDTFEGRWEKYVTAAERCKRKLVLDIWVFCEAE
ncbi:MAG: polymorphic toxin-type HINT domain-containing protein [Gemmataceae bacterium]